MLSFDNPVKFAEQLLPKPHIKNNGTFLLTTFGCQSNRQNDVKNPIKLLYA